MKRALVFTLLLACKTAIPNGDPVDCSEACKVLRGYGCPEGYPTDAGASCEEVCRAAGAILPVSCVSHADSEYAVQVCGVRCRK